jgi:hypothetical protein
MRGYGEHPLTTQHVSNGIQASVKWTSQRFAFAFPISGRLSSFYFAFLYMYPWSREADKAGEGASPHDLERQRGQLLHRRGEWSPRCRTEFRRRVPPCRSELGAAVARCRTSSSGRSEPGAGASSPTRIFSSIFSIRVRSSGHPRPRPPTPLRLPTI